MSKPRSHLDTERLRWIEEQHDIPPSERGMPFWFRFALFAKRVAAVLRREGEAERVAAGLAEENVRLRGYIHADAVARGLPLKIGPWDQATGRSDMSIAATG